MSTKSPQVKNRLENGEAAPKPPEEVLGVVIPRIQPAIIELEIIGITPLLVCAWDEKTKRQIEDSQTGKAHKKKPPRDPKAEYEASLYVSTDGWTGVPAGGMKGCLVNACRAVDGLPMTLAKRMIFIRSQGLRVGGGQQLLRVYGKHRMHEGMVRTTTGVAMPRYRPIYDEWSMKLQIEFLSNIVTAEQVANLVELAGYVEGLCEHRPGAPKSNTGDYGRFQIRREE